MKQSTSSSLSSTCGFRRLTATVCAFVGEPVAGQRSLLPPPLGGHTSCAVSTTAEVALR